MMREILQDMWGGLVNVTTYKHVIVIAMFLLFLSFGYYKYMEDSSVKEYKAWLNTEDKTIPVVPDHMVKMLNQSGYYKVVDNELELKLIKELNKKGFYEIDDVILNEIKDVKKSNKINNNSLKMAGFYKIDNQSKIDEGLKGKLNSKGYFSINDDSIIKHIEEYANNNSEEKAKFYDTVLVKGLRERADNDQIPFDSLNNILKATVPGSNVQPHTYVVHVASNSNYVDKILLLKNNKTSNYLILLGKPNLGEIRDAHKIHLNQDQMDYLLGTRGHKANLEFIVQPDERELSDRTCFPANYNQTRTQKLCPNKSVKKGMTRVELEAIMNSTS